MLILDERDVGNFPVVAVGGTLENRGVRACLCVCVHERGREREREGEIERGRERESSGP